MFDIPVNLDNPVVSEEEWHSAHPTFSNSSAPCSAAVLGGAGCGGAESRMKAAKFTTSDDTFAGVPSSSSVASSGAPLNTQPITALRSLGNTSFATPCSTL